MLITALKALRSRDRQGACVNPVLLLVAALLIGCTHQILIPVPPREFRSEAQAAERIPLPLADAAARARLLTFLRAGGDARKAKKGKPAVDPNPEARYGALLDLLGRSSPALTLDDLTKKPTFQRWFHGPVMWNVIDARDEAYPKDAVSPAAVTDGSYWWVFYPAADGRLGLRAFDVQLRRHLLRPERLLARPGR